MQLLVSFQIALAVRNDERGAAMAEYGLLLALVALATVFVLSTVGEAVFGTYDETNRVFLENLPEAARSGGSGGAL